METATEKNGKSEENVDWNVDTEVQLFHAMKGHKPIGVNRYFQMACIHQKFSTSLNKDIHSRIIWDHLDTMYDMAALHESEILPFPNNERDFNLPETEFRDLLCQRAGGRPLENAQSSDDEQVRTPSKRQDSSDTPKREGDAPKSSGKTSRVEQQSRKEPPRSTGGKVRPEHAHGKVRSDSTPTSKAKPEVKPKSEPPPKTVKATESKAESKESRTSTPKAESKDTPKRAEPPRSAKENTSRKSETGRTGGSRSQDEAAPEKGKSSSSSNRSAKDDADSSAKRGATKRRQDQMNNKPPSPMVTQHSKRRR
uniref:Putative chromatin modification-related protein eaf7 n=1 Tax=Ornithodoros turicata TaxID=34597 RepID=A0A2R5LK18_9ACAR